MPSVLGGRGHHHSFSESEPKRVDTNLRRSASSLSLKYDASAQEDKVTILTRMFWIAVAMLQSDFEYEFLLAVKLLSKVILDFLLSLIRGAVKKYVFFMVK